MIKGANILVTGGAGFIGSALCRNIIKQTNNNLIILDKLTYASNMNALDEIINEKNVCFYEGSIGNVKFVEEILLKHTPKYVFNLAAETHVDNSITNPSTFVKTNILDTHTFFNTILKYFLNLSTKNALIFKLLHVSTDEVYGDISLDQKPVNETTAYNPSSPYSASKAAADHLIRAYYRTYGLPGLVSNCSNNYGPYQNNEKFIPVIINKLLNGDRVPIYGDGNQIREWIYVDDHCKALLLLMKHGKIGENYNIGSGVEINNKELIKNILYYIEKKLLIQKKNFNEHINFVDDRLGHDKRYAINSSKINQLCNWKPTTNFDTGIKKTINTLINVKG